MVCCLLLPSFDLVREIQDKCFEMTTEEAEMASSIDICTKIAKVTTFLKMRLIGISSHDVTFVQKNPPPPLFVCVFHVGVPNQKPK